MEGRNYRIFSIINRDFYFSSEVFGPKIENVFCKYFQSFQKMSNFFVLTELRGPKAFKKDQKM